MSKDLIDTKLYTIIIGNLLQNPSLLDDIDRPLAKRDFEDGSYHQCCFIIINNLHFEGCETIDEVSISSYLDTHPKSKKTFEEGGGYPFLLTAKQVMEASVDNYDYYYHKLKKLSLLRYYESQGLNTQFIYNTTIPDSDPAREVEQNKFNTYTEQDIVDLVNDTFVATPTTEYCSNTLSTDIQAGQGMLELVEEYQEIPDVGLPLNNEGLNTITRGARKGCVFMRSATQGGGKSRMQAGDICKIAVPYFYDSKEKKWKYTGFSEPSVYITTEMTPDEIQTILIATVSKVNEEHILNGEYEKGEYERVVQAIEYIEAAPLYIIHIPDFSIEDIKNLIKKYYRERGVEYFFFDYVHTSLRLMAEITSKSGIGLKEHQLLLVFITELKTIAQKYDVMIFTASQLNGEAISATYKDQNLLAGAKSLANKLDVGIISMAPSKAEKKKLEPIIHKRFGPKPNMGHWVYKVRRGKLTRIIVWTFIDLGTMTETPLFVTNYDFELIDVDFTKIESESVEKIIKDHSIPLKKIEDSGTILETDDEEPKPRKTSFVF